MSDRLTRKADHRERHDGQQSHYLSGPVKQIVKHGVELAKLPDRSWDEQIEEIRRLTSKLLGLVAIDIDAGVLSPEIIARLKDVSTIAKQHMAVKTSDAGMSDADLERIAGQR